MTISIGTFYAPAHRGLPSGLRVWFAHASYVHRVAQIADAERSSPIGLLLIAPSIVARCALDALAGTIPTTPLSLWISMRGYCLPVVLMVEFQNGVPRLPESTPAILKSLICMIPSLWDGVSISTRVLRP